MDFSPETRTFFQTILTSINQQPKTEIRGNKTLSSQSKANFFPLQIATIQFLTARERRLDLEWSKLGGWFTLGGSSLTESRADAYSGMGNTRLRDTLSHLLLEWATISTGPNVSGNQCLCVAQISLPSSHEQPVRSRQMFGTYTTLRVSKVSQSVFV